MNREQIIAKWNTLAPRERDVWVAEVVTEVKREKRRIPCPDGNYGCAVAHYAYFPRYTTDISAAWEVVEYLRKYWLVQIRDCDMFGWIIDLLSDSEYRTDIGGIHAQKVEEAICLAAIISKLAKEEYE